MKFLTSASGLMKFVLIYCVLFPLFMAEYVPQPSNGEENATTCEEVVNSPSNGTIILGSNQVYCRVNITTALVQIRKVDFSDNTKFLFAAQYSEYLGDVSSYKALSVGTVPPCFMQFSSDYVELHIRGDFEVRLLESRESSAVPTTRVCRDIIRYDDVHVCHQKTTHNEVTTVCSPKPCRPQKYPSPFLVLPCNKIIKCSLGYKNVTCDIVQLLQVKRTVTHLFFTHNVVKLKIRANLTSIDDSAFIGLERIKALDLSRNDFVSIRRGVFSTLRSLDELKLSHNLLTNITKEVFAGLEQIKILHLDNNLLESLPEDAFENLSSLSQLYLSSNKLTSLSPGIFQNVPQLTMLYLANNKLVSLDQKLFQNLVNLDLLSLGGNQLITIDPGTFSNLSLMRLLILEKNLLTDIPKDLFRGLESVMILNLESNRIKKVNPYTFDGLYMLMQLMLKNNQIEAIENGAFRGCSFLEYLYTDNNIIRFIQSGALKELKYISYLNLANNSLSNIESDNFKYLHSLKKLLLQENHLPKLPSETMELKSLEILNASHNSLDQIPIIGELVNLKSVDLRQNSLVHIKKRTFDGLSNKTTIYVDHEAICRYVNLTNTGETSICLGTEAVLPFFTGKKLLLSTALSVFTWILGITSLLGNTFVVGWRCLRQGDEDAVQSLLIMNLALSDLLMGLYLLIIASADAYFGAEFPLHSHKWVFAGGCDLAGILSVTSSEASVFFVTLISIDRYIRVVHPHTKYRLRIKSTYVSSLLMWLVSFMISIIPLVLKKTKQDFYDMSEVCIGLPLVKKPIIYQEKIKTINDRLPDADLQNASNNNSIYQAEAESNKVIGLEVMRFSSTIFLGINLICFIAVLFCYIAILHIVYKVSRKIKRRGSREREIKMAAKMAVIVLTDFSCWMPIILMGILVQCGAIDLSPTLIAWTVTFILPVNSSVNPYLYSIIAVLAKQIKETKDRRSFKLRSTNTACHTAETNETAVSLCNLVGIGTKKKSSKGNLTECSTPGKIIS